MNIVSAPSRFHVDGNGMVKEPTFGQNSLRSFAQSAWMPILERLAGTKFWSLYRQGCRHRNLRDEERAAVQRRLAQRLLRHAGQNVPLWRERLTDDRLAEFESDAGNFEESFRQLPTTSKADMRNGFPEQVTSGGSREQWRYGSSAGTVDRVTIVSDFNKRDHLRATNLRVVAGLIGSPLGARIVEIPPDACNVVCALRDEGPLELSAFVMWAAKKGILFKRETRPDLRGRLERSLIIRQDTFEPLQIKAYDALTTQLDHQLDRLITAKPNVLRGLPLFLLWLGERAKERQLDFPTLEAITPYGGLMSVAMAQRVSAAFGAPFFDYYGTSEIGGIAQQRAGEKGMRVFDDQVLVEIVDNENRPLPPGPVGRVLVTDFHNFAMPVIRYEIGDCGRWLAEDNSSHDQFELSRNGRLEIVGRQVETTRLPSDHLVSAREVMDILFADGAILNACVEGKSGGEYLVKLAARREVGSDTIRALQAALELEKPPRVRDAEYLRPEKSGKFQIFKPGR